MSISVAALDLHRGIGRPPSLSLWPLRNQEWHRALQPARGQVMTRPPYKDARRVFWIVDNCSAHRGARAAERLKNLYPRLTLVHAPVHASWLNQIEIYFSIVQRTVLTPNDFPISTLSPSAFWTFNTI
jgi:hypothetical protein